MRYRKKFDRGGSAGTVGDGIQEVTGADVVGVLKRWWKCFI